MRNKKIVIFISLIILFSIFNLSIINVKGQKTIDYVFNNEVLYDKEFTEQEYTNEYNVRNPEYFSEIYNATYSFDSSLDFIGFPPSPKFWDVGVEGGSILVIDNLDNHSRVVELIDISIVYDIDLTTTFSAKTFGLVSYWIQITDSTKRFIFNLVDGSSNGVSIMIDDGKLQSYSGGWNDITNGVINNDIWYHIKINFSCITDKFDFYLNGILTDSNLDFTSPIISITKIFCQTRTVDSGYIIYLDSIDYSWIEGYYENRNLIPVIYKDTSILEPDKDTFTFLNSNVFYPNGYNNASSWTDIEQIGSNDVKIGIPNQPEQTTQRCYKIVKEGSTSNNNPIGITKEFITPIETSNIVNVSISFEIDDLGTINDSFNINIYSNSFELIIDVIIDYSGGLGQGIRYFNGSEYVPLFLALEKEKTIDLNFYIDYNTNITLLDIFSSEVVNEKHIFPLLTTSDIGIGNITLINKFLSEYTFTSTLEIWIYSVGVYHNGISDSNEFCYVTTAITGFSEWIYNQHNIFQINGNGVFEINATTGFVSAYNQGYFPSFQMYDIKEKYNHTNILNTTNLYFNQDNGSIASPFLVFYIYSNFSIDSIEIKGVSLNYINKYWLEFSFSNININDNYFYVDNSNNLRFNLLINDTNLEFIQASFNIVDISTNNYYNSFKGNINGNAIGNFRIVYQNTTDIIEIPHYTKSINTFISQNEIIDKFVVIISDNNDNSKSGFTTSGFISNIRLRFASNIDISITTFNLINLIIPLIIILIPTIAISSNYGKNLIIPLFVLMSIICVITNIIPIWLFFIIMISILTFIFLRKQEGVSIE